MVVSLKLKVLQLVSGQYYYVLVIVYNVFGMFSVMVNFNGVLVDFIVLVFLRFIRDGNDFN